MGTAVDCAMGYDGAPGEIRTPDLTLRRRSLYPAELRARFSRIAQVAVRMRCRLRLAGRRHPGSLAFPRCFALYADFLHHGLNESFGAFHTGQYGLQVKCGLGRVTRRGAIYAVLTDHDQ